MDDFCKLDGLSIRTKNKDLIESQTQEIERKATFCDNLRNHQMYLATKIAACDPEIKEYIKELEIVPPLTRFAIYESTKKFPKWAGLAAEKKLSKDQLSDLLFSRHVKLLQ